MFSRAAYRPATASNHPHRRFRPVVVPYSSPASTRISASVGSASDGKGPEPTRVQYAFVIPMIRSMSRGPTPAPTHAPPAIGFDDVTKG